MKRRTLKIILWIAGPSAFALAILGFCPGFAYQLGDPSKLQIEKRYRTGYHSLRVYSAVGHLKYEWAPGDL
jgi:hypothetical protein